MLYRGKHFKKRSSRYISGDLLKDFLDKILAKISGRHSRLRQTAARLFRNMNTEDKY